MKEFLSQKGVRYVEKDVSVDRDAANEMVNKSGQMGVPVIVVDDEVVIGFDRERLERLISADGVRRPPFGLKIADASSIAMKQGGIPVFGAYVGSVRPGSIAGKMGLQTGDIITELNMQPIHNSTDIETALARLSIGARFQIVFTRGSQTLKAEASYQ